MQAVLNTPDLWLDEFPIPAESGHKYQRGHAMIFGAPSLTGATRLAATACSRVGAGLVTVLARQRGDVYRASLPADIMVRKNSTKITHTVSAVLGGGGGITARDKAALLKNRFNIPRIIDAEALPYTSSFADLDSSCVLTPHAGELAKLFPDFDGAPEKQVQQAAQRTGAIVVLKGAQTIIADATGRLVRNTHASPYLAKAGTGDVLAGLIAGLIAQKMRPFEACCAAVWIHGEAAKRIGPGLVASDLHLMVPNVLQYLKLYTRPGEQLKL